jgi:hypothetical protein
VSELCLSFDKCFQCMFLSGDIVVGLQDRLWTASFVAFQCPPARHDGPAAVAPGVNKLAVPPASAQQAGKNLLRRLGKVRLQELADNSADRFFAPPTVLLLGASIP